MNNPDPLNTNPATKGPLHGLLVVAMEQAVAAPLCTARLADAGARVIKIERERGDFARGYDTAAAGDSSYFAWLNHGKESLTLNFKEAEDEALLRRLLQQADVFVQNLAPGSMARHGFADETLRALYPRLITCNISGYGESDAVSELKAYDLLVQAESGLLSISGAPGAPGRIGVSLCDIGCGVSAHAGILEALIQRGITGVGKSVNVSLFGVTAEWMSVPLVHAETGDGAPRPVGLQHPSIAPYGAYTTNDNALTLIAIQNEVEWETLCRQVLQLPKLLANEKFSDNVARVSNRHALENELQTCIQQWSADEFRQRLANSAIAFGAVNSVEELATHRALHRRHITASTGQNLSLPAHPYHAIDSATNTPKQGEQRVPMIGEHSQSIRQEFSA